jgi:Domain of unknown function (DUF4304)
MDYKKLFYVQLKEEFVPLLRQDGFKGSGQDFRRVNGDVIHAVNIQNNKYGGSCCVNMGLHFAFLPVCWDSNKMPDLKNIKTLDCEFRCRLAPDGKTDYWWKFKGRLFFGSTRKSVSHLCNTYTEVGRRYFEKYNGMESITLALSLDLLINSQYFNVAGGVISVRGAWTMARYYKHIDNKDLQKHYAGVGLQNLENAKALKTELEFLAE